MTVDQGTAKVSDGQLNLDGGQNVFTKLKDAQDSVVDYDTEPVTSASDDEEDIFADVSMPDEDDDDEEYARPIKSGSSDASETIFTSSTAAGSHRGRGIAAKPSSSSTFKSLDDIEEGSVSNHKKTTKKKGLGPDMVHVSGYLRLDIHTQFLLSEHGICSLDDLGSLKPKKWRRIHDLVHTVTGDDEQARKISVLRQWVRSIQIPVEEGERIPKDWRPLFLEALPQLKADARRTDWTNSEDVQMRFIDALPYSWGKFITSLSQCGIGSLPAGDDY